MSKLLQLIQWARIISSTALSIKQSSESFEKKLKNSFAEQSSGVDNEEYASAYY